MRDEAKEFLKAGIGILVIFFIILALVTALGGCKLIDEEKLKDLVRAQVEANIGFTPLYKAKVADTIAPGDHAGGDIIKHPATTAPGSSTVSVGTANGETTSLWLTRGLVIFFAALFIIERWDRKAQIRKG